VDDKRAGELQQDNGPIFGPGLLLTLASAASFPFDRVLAGMVAAGHGIEAICRYLDLAPDALLEHVVRLGLATPHDRPLRRPGRWSWSDPDTKRLIAWRVAKVHPETIAAQLRRTTCAVRAKSRRLGIPTPDRKSLRKCDPTTLEDPDPGFGFGDVANTAPSTSGATSLCGRAAGQASIGGAYERTQIVTSPPAKPGSEQADSLPIPVRGSAERTEGQHELQLRVVPDPEPGPSPVPDRQPAPVSQPRAPVTKPVAPVPLREEDVDFNDLTWLAHLKNPVKNRLAVWTFGLLRFGGLHWRTIAERIGRTPRSTSTLLHRCDVPRDSDRSKFGSSFDQEAAFATVKELGFEVKFDEPKREYFWRCKGDRARPMRNRKSRLEMGAEDPYRTRTYSFVTRRDLDARRGRDAPFAETPAMIGAS
jgi:hypothetical protein